MPLKLIYMELIPMRESHSFFSPQKLQLFFNYTDIFTY